MVLEVSKACRLVEGKGHDRVVAVRMGAHEGTYLTAVADGLTSEDGGSAAQWAVDTLARIAGRDGRDRSPDAREVFNELSRHLADDARTAQLPDSHTTLTCGIVQQVDESRFLFDFFGIGDSPVWKLVQPMGSGLDFQAFVVYGGPIPGEQGRVYSTLNLRNGSVDGSVYFGSASISKGEVLVLTSDGVPDVRIIWDDQDPKRGKFSPKLGLRLLNQESVDHSLLGDMVAAYDKMHLLVDDDASLVVVRLVQRIVPGLAEGCAVEDPRATHRSLGETQDTAPAEANSRTEPLGEDGVVPESAAQSEDEDRVRAAAEDEQIHPPEDGARRRGEGETSAE